MATQPPPKPPSMSTLLKDGFAPTPAAAPWPECSEAPLADTRRSCRCRAAASELLVQRCCCCWREACAELAAPLPPLPAPPARPATFALQSTLRASVPQLGHSIAAPAADVLCKVWPSCPGRRVQCPKTRFIRQARPSSKPWPQCFAEFLSLRPVRGQRSASAMRGQPGLPAAAAVGH